MIALVSTARDRQYAHVPDDVPLSRWGLLSGPAESIGAYVMIEELTTAGWKIDPSADALRLWHRTPGAADDDTKNRTVWFPRHQLPEWLSTYTVDEWLPEGSEPNWD